MSNSIADAASEYSRQIKNLKDIELKRSMTDDIPEDLQTALVRLYYAKLIASKIEKCSELLDEDTAIENAEALESAKNATDAAADNAFSAVEAYEKEDREFKDMIEGLSVNSDMRGLFWQLCKLYKCEGIIRAAYMSTSRLMLFGPYGEMPDDQSDAEVIVNEEDYIKHKIGVDIYELLEIRQRLIEEARTAIEDSDIIVKGLGYEACDI